jgi:hypothetical protein
MYQGASWCALAKGMAMMSNHTEIPPKAPVPDTVTGGATVARSWYSQVRSIFSKPHVSLMSEAHACVPAADHPSQSITSLVGTIPSLRFATPTGLRDLADSTSREQIEMGDAVTRQGEHSDAVFFIVDGTFEVLISHFGHTPDFIRMLRAGDSFGELGVLYDVPRTATVRCGLPGQVLRIPGEAFLDALDTGG